MRIKKKSLKLYQCLQKTGLIFNKWNVFLMSLPLPYNSFYAACSSNQSLFVVSLTEQYAKHRYGPSNSRSLHLMLLFLARMHRYHISKSVCSRWAIWKSTPTPRSDRILTGSVSIVLRCDDKASTAKQLKRTPLITEYQKSLEGSSMTKVTTKSA